MEQLQLVQRELGERPAGEAAIEDGAADRSRVVVESDVQIGGAECRLRAARRSARGLQTVGQRPPTHHQRQQEGGGLDRHPSAPADDEAHNDAGREAYTPYTYTTTDTLQLRNVHLKQGNA